MPQRRFSTKFEAEAVRLVQTSWRTQSEVAARSGPLGEPPCTRSLGLKFFEATVQGADMLGHRKTRFVLVSVRDRPCYGQVLRVALVDVDGLPEIEIPEPRCARVPAPP